MPGSDQYGSFASGNQVCENYESEDFSRSGGDCVASTDCPRPDSWTGSGGAGFASEICGGVGACVTAASNSTLENKSLYSDDGRIAVLCALSISALLPQS